MLGMISLLLVVYVLLFFTRIASIILMSTGLSEKVAHFQARSAVTGCGFTTAESELITNHGVRRKVISYLMIAGNVGVIATISSFLMGMISVNNDRYHYEILFRLAILAAGMLILWGLAKCTWFDRLILKIFRPFLLVPGSEEAINAECLYRLPGGYGIHEIHVAAGSPAAQQTVGELRKLLGDARLLGLNRGSGQFISEPAPEVKLQPNDALVLYTDDDRRNRIAEQCRGPAAA